MGETRVLLPVDCTNSRKESYKEAHFFFTLSKRAYPDIGFLLEDVFFIVVSSSVLHVLIMFFWLFTIISLKLWMNSENILGKSLEKDVVIALEILDTMDSMLNDV